MAYDLAVLSQYGVSTDVIQQLNVAVKDNYGDSFGEAFSRLTLKGFRFSIRSGTSEELLSNDAIEVLVLGDAKADHLVYFAEKYDPNKSDVKPAAVWYQGTDAPVTVPQVALTKDAQGRYGYVRQHRAVVLIKDPAKDTWMPTPIVYDIGSMSLYGTDVQMPDGTCAMSYSSFRRWCASQNVPPFLVPTRIIFDRRASVPCARFIPAKNGTAPMIIQKEYIQQVLKMATSQTVKDLLDVKLIDGTEENTDNAGYSDDEAVAPQKAKASKAKAQPAPQPQAEPAPVAQPQPQPQPQPQVEPVQQAAAEPIAQADAVLGQTEAIDDELNSLLNMAGAFN